MNYPWHLFYVWSTSLILYDRDEEFAHCMGYGTQPLIKPCGILDFYKLTGT